MFMTLSSTIPFVLLLVIAWHLGLAKMEKDMYENKTSIKTKFQNKSFSMTKIFWMELILRCTSEIPLKDWDWKDQLLEHNTAIVNGRIWNRIPNKTPILKEGGLLDVLGEIQNNYSA